MKKLLYILFALSLSVSFVACGGEEETPEERPTTIVFIHDFEELNDIRISPYLYEDFFKDFYYIIKINNIKKNTYSLEYLITNELYLKNDREYFVFYDHESDETKAYRHNKSFIIEKGKKNIFRISKSDGNSILIKDLFNNPDNYPYGGEVSPSID